MGANNVPIVKRLIERKLIGPPFFIDILYSRPKGERPLIILVKGSLAVRVGLEIEKLLNSELGFFFNSHEMCLKSCQI